ncbi:response regulator [Hymenobacter caeli]|uniref:CheY-like chemotaxis protein n=1 Tax=Hymenobacter caeli TaxID=2735894 RepID=A0ABX2FNA1_9BACT|nr:response regulator [Hymenobacter caeli]NRT18646.1 CheY-like chemotaxis protein [Hymenobacter caeli]
MKAFELVYVVEDDWIASVVTEMLLEQNEAFGTVRKFTNGQSALNALRQATEIPDLILLDLNMPVMDGWEFLEGFSALLLPKRVPVCVLTSSIHPNDIAKSKSYKEVAAYFSKPLDDDTLVQIVRLLG